MPEESSTPNTPTLPSGMDHCISIDLELATQDNSIQAIAAYRPDTGDSLHFKGEPSPQEWQRLEALADQADFVLGHNLIAHDLPHLEAINPGSTALLQSQSDRPPQEEHQWQRKSEPNSSTPIQPTSTAKCTA